jgi:NTP pyrophosphatase (non-canonical NTP hydrolase)
MTNEEYLKQSARTADPEQCRDVADKIIDDCSQRVDLLHAALGLTTETGEFADSIKRHLFYNDNLDMVNLKEELGDILWYAALALRAIGASFDQVMQMNIDKLKARFPYKFDYNAVLNRDLDKERSVLEG